MKYVFVGDVHGKVEAVEKALGMDGKIVFVGDFMDSFDRLATEHAKCLELVCDAIEAGKAEAIYGNHELSYILPWHRCSGWTVENEGVMRARAGRLDRLFKPHLLLAPDFLVTHAGLTKQVWDEAGLAMDSLSDRLWAKWRDRHSPIHWIGRFRGGRDPVGGTFWCDFRAEFEEVPGLRQVFGHTAGSGIRRVGDSYCIDCLGASQDFLELDL